ncbi:CPBP family intramembrane metalloprotease domain-containing protein [Micromonospora ureilytica]|uniref:CPBP family intramembrane metalloprotease domain-containing protein n=1 Tax=Micromonospora ureilytica TaxID=709868 RepID=A0A3N9Y372_9ACTN|nr:CPBP family intramembrane glutamic endopeptidase [Micromonospora ureilytica]RQX19680.1 CPBP family intramembrane metalloprotease domain-containing protein [Micromonospora ureilytica]
MLRTAPPGSPYHRLGRTDRHRWWKPIVGTLALLASAAVVTGLLFIVAAVVGELANRPYDADGFPTFGPIPDTALLVASLALLLPLVLGTVWLVQRRPAGTVSSVLGRLRWGWLGRCLLIATPLIIVMLFGANLLLGLTDESSILDPVATWVGWPEFAAGLLMVLLLVPFQAAAEEYAFRGWLLQAVGAYLRTPWPGIAFQAVLFAAAHGWGSGWGFLDLVFMGVLLGWLTVRTGGLEAAIALHVVNNLSAFTVAAAFGGLSADETMADAPWQLVLVDVVALSAYALVIDRLAARRGLATVVPPALVVAVPGEPSALTGSEPQASNAGVESRG